MKVEYAEVEGKKQNYKIRYVQNALYSSTSVHVNKSRR